MHFTPDPSQKEVIEIHRGCHLVLAPPGCGKTQILTERIRYAHNVGVAYDDMLCLTFTNRAARGMKERIMHTLVDNANSGNTADNAEEPVTDGNGIEQIFVGNIHRFCARFLFENALVPAETSVIDDADAISIIARFLNEDEMFAAANNRRRKDYFSAVQLAALMHQIKKRHPKSIRLHPECLSADDIAVLRELCNHTQRPFNSETMLDIFHHPDTYRTLVGERQSAVAEIPSAPLSVPDGAQAGNIVAGIGFVRSVHALLSRMEVALYYSDYKRENNLVDFEDLLLLAYDALAEDSPAKLYKRYRWVQIDEVQDLNPMQLKIVDLLSTDVFPDAHVIYLGDEQQAIFSFMGAKMSTLELLKDRCKGNIHRLVKNHRSPKYLLQVFNHYAYHVLKISRDMLPTSDSTPVRMGDELVVLSSSTLDNEYLDVAQQAQRLAGNTDDESERMPHADGRTADETVAVIVSSNNDADIISEKMAGLGVKHFKVSGTDMFSLPDMKLILAHLAVFANEHNFIAWARILKGFRVYEQNASARKFMREMMDCALLPTDLFTHSTAGLSAESCVMQFHRICSDGAHEVVVFDTETTGLSITDDDIVQIAAVKMRGGEVVGGSAFNVFIQTSREIPAMLGDVPNPVIEALKHNKAYPPEEALRMFIDYVGNDVLLAHNARFDYHILDWNLRRYLPSVNLREQCPVCFDSLKLARLLEPSLYQYKLKYLLETLHLEGENSHLADADVAATCSVVKHCLRRAEEVIPRQVEFLKQKTVRERAAVLRRNYQPVYDMTCDSLYTLQDDGQEALLASMLGRVYETLLADGFVKPVKGYGYMVRYVVKELVDTKKEKTLYEQIAAHVLEISTLKESDLCSRDIVDERVFVTTVHKAKGLEFDNVIVFDVADDRYPGYFARGDEQLMAEDARKLYVAMTRARRRLMIAVAAIRHDYHGMPIHRNLSRFMTPVLRFFSGNAPGSTATGS